ncbi:MAG: PIN/TRAM domain-containing protein [Oscillospiraceae bacterium]|nr:PIN/TRAM domain-containing protein [Oscillospiraceae bacterium]
MIDKIVRAFIVVAGLITGYFASQILLSLNFYIITFINKNIVTVICFYIIIIILIGLISFVLSKWISKFVVYLKNYTEYSIQKMSSSDILFGLVGALIGLLFSLLLLIWFMNKNIVLNVVFAMISVLLAITFANISVKKKDDFINFFMGLRKASGASKEKKLINKQDYKILDTSVIIDGRIFDICQTGFVEGVLVIPNFVLTELRHIADSSDPLKRTRGRRGLDILNKIQKELKIEVNVMDKDFNDIYEVDAKILKLAHTLNAKVLTNDYNLNKVAEVQGVEVLNINDLSNAVKPVVIPGEEMTMQVIKDGKEVNQGIGYLDDGTMIVVEGGRKYIGDTINVIVTSVLQTSAGRMIFGKAKQDYQ